MMTDGDLAYLSAVAALLWLGIIVVLHFLKPGLDPKTRMVSEYACAPLGWIMRLAFFCMAVSCWALAAAMWTHQQPIGVALLAICGIGFAGAGAYVTDPVLPTERTQTRSGALHILFAFAVMLLFPVTATIVGADIAGDIGRPIRAWLPALTVLTWAGLLGFMGAALYSSRKPGIPLGYFERFLIVTYTGWLIAAALALVG